MVGPFIFRRGWKMATDVIENVPVIRNDMFGRLDIYASFDDITPENVKEELNSALTYH